MKKWLLITSLFQLLVGLAGVAAYIVIALGGEPLGKWTITLFLAIAYIIIGIVGILGIVKRDKE